MITVKAGTKIDETKYLTRKLHQCRCFIVTLTKERTFIDEAEYKTLMRDAEDDVVYYQARLAGRTHEEAQHVAYTRGVVE